MTPRAIRPGGLLTWAILAALCLLAPTAKAQNTGPDQLQACAFRHPIRNIKLLADLPPAVRVQLSKSPMAEKGAKFNSSDVIVLGPSGKMPALPGTRFIAAGQWQNLVYVWYEAGGIALFHHLTLFRLEGGGAANKIADRFDNGQDPCTATDAALDAATPR